MSSASKAIIILLLTASAVAQNKELRVCADPNNLPYSNRQEQGFENALVKMLADDLHMQLKYVWEPQRSAFFRKTLNAGRCDLVAEVPAGFDEAVPSKPYYRSTYVFVTRGDRALNLRSIDDPRLQQMRIGVHIVGDDMVPPARLLVNRGLVHNLIGFSIFGTLDMENPPARLIDAVADGKVDVAASWGPLAGYFAQHSSVPLKVQPICSDAPSRLAPLVFTIAMGVRRGEEPLLRQVNDFISRRKPDIDRLLASYGVPLTDAQVALSCKGRS
jgi:quinoprotein dehydrogenase-associated probable ABC transporter substrate-binding protein